MKTIKLFLGAALALCSFTFLGCPPPTPIVSSDIIARYPFDGNLLDSSGHHHNATASGAITYTLDRFGRRSHALLMSGTTSLLVQDSADLDFNSTSSFSITAWVKTVDTSDAGIVCKGPATNLVPGYQLGLKGGHASISITATGANLELTSSQKVADNRWHLLTLTASPSLVCLYVDTVLVGQHAGAHLRPDSLNSGPLHIGARPDGNHLFAGYLDETTLYDIAITPSMLASIFRLRSDPVTAMSDLPAGVTFMPVKNVNNALGMCWLNFDTGYYCGTNGSIARSTDHGSTWVQQTSGTQETLRRISFAADGFHGVAVGDDGTVLTIANAGQNWTPNNGQLFSTIDGGSVTDVHLTDVKFITSLTVIAVGRLGTFPTDGGFVMISMDGGGTWSAPSTVWNASAGSVPIQAITCIGRSTAAASSFWAAGVYGEVLAWDGATGDWNLQDMHWTSYALPDQNTTVRCCDMVDQTNGFAGTDDGQIYQTNTGAWVQLRPTGGYTVAGIWGQNISDQYAALDALSGGYTEVSHYLGGSHWPAVTGSPSSNPWIYESSDGPAGCAILPLASGAPTLAWRP